MIDPPPLAFVSYRRQDTSPIARWLGESLQLAFGHDSVFIDTEVIRIGDRWPGRIDHALASASAVLAVIGPNWLRMADEFGRRRLDHEEDWVRRELQHAINRRLLLIPLLVSRATLPAKRALPDCLMPMVDHQAIELRDSSWESDRNVVIDRLVQVGFQRVREVPSASPTPYSDVIRSQQVVLFEQQFATLKTALALVYRARNAARALKESPQHTATGDARDRLDSLRTLHESIENLLYDERALLPEQLFRVAHGLKHHLLLFVMEVDRYRRLDTSREDGSGPSPRTALEDIYVKLDQDYELLVKLVQGHAGLGGP